MNPPQEQPESPGFGWTFRSATKSCKPRTLRQGSLNGDIRARIRKIDEEGQELTVDYDGTAVTYDFNELDELALAYALTIHKSQGSDIPQS